jgi:hypothetical protein
MDVIHSGWLVKSPPEKKIQAGQWFGKIFQAKWRRRYFILHVPPASASLPGAPYELAYYDNANLRKKLGSIDLDQCEQIIATLDSAHYKHLFALRTKHKGRDRTYYLAADADTDMNKWVECLCKVCGFKPDPQQEDDGAVRSTRQDNYWPSESAPSQPLTSQAQSIRSTNIQNSPILTRAASSVSSVRSEGTSTPDTPVRRTSAGEAYIPLGSCFSDSRKSPLDRPSTRKPSGGSPLDQVPPPPSLQKKHGGSRDSIPDMPAPPPPMKTGQPLYPDHHDPNMTYDLPSKLSYVNIDDLDAGDEGLYKVPPRRNVQPETPEEDGLYKVPPSRHLEFVPTSDDWYQVPPSRQAENFHNYNNLPPTVTSFDSREFDYDVPPSAKPLPRNNSQRDSNSSSGSRGSQKQDSAYGSEDTFYSVPPARVDAQSMEMLTDRMRTNTVNYRNGGGDDTYDVPPRKTQSETNILDSVPPPPRPPKGGPASPTGPMGPYLNIPPNSKSHQMEHRESVVESLYDTPPKKPSDAAMLSMSPPPPQPCSVAGKMPRYVNHATGSYPIPGGQTDSMYLPMQGGPVTTDDMYMPMNSRDSLYTDMSGIHGLYTAPPSNRPINQTASYSAKPGTVPPKLQKITTSPSAGEGELVAGKKEDATYVIYSTNRTRSFKRTVSPAGGDIKLPTVKRSTHEDVSSSDEEDSDSVGSNTPSLDNQHLKQALTADVPNKKNLNSTPPPPPRSGEVQYLDLDLDDNSDSEKSPVFGGRQPPAASSSEATDYKEIDFIKTNALTHIRKGLESKRKSSEKSIDE